MMIISMSQKRVLVTIISRIFILLLFCTFAFTSPSCPPSSCGTIRDIHYPFRLKTNPSSCQSKKHAPFLVDCSNNQTVFNLTSEIQFYVHEINYTNRTVRVVDPGIHRENLSSCPLYSLTLPTISQVQSVSYESVFLRTTYYINTQRLHLNGQLKEPIIFTHCLSPVSSVKYVKASFCGNTRNIFANANSSDFYSYIIVGDMLVSELEDSCTVDKVTIKGPLAMGHNPSLESIYGALAYGFELQILPHTWRDILSAFFGTTIILGLSLYVLLVSLRFVIGFPLLICFVVHKWRKRHLCMEKSIEDFLQGQHNLVPIHYTYSDIKKMTNTFAEKLGEGGCGIVYKGKLRSGPYAAVKMMEQSTATEEEFINEVGSIGQIHHVNVVQLIGFCVERSKYALVYEFLPNGSLDRYIFNQESLGVAALTCDKMFEIALGVARGINYLHHGCNVQILHFDIKPHNILLDENFNPKISDFGLARLHPTNESFINLTAARGTMGYMAPEMFYKNMGRISHKADIYSFGMLLMEIATRRKNTNPLVEDISQIFFPSWVYYQLCAGNDIDIKDATEEEQKVMKKIIIVALWCIQMRPSDRPAINKIVEMLEGEVDQRLPSKPFVAPHEMARNNHGITTSYSVDYVSVDN